MLLLLLLVTILVVIRNANLSKRLPKTKCFECWVIMHLWWYGSQALIKDASGLIRFSLHFFLFVFFLSFDFFFVSYIWKSAMVAVYWSISCTRSRQRLGGRCTCRGFPALSRDLCSKFWSTNSILNGISFEKVWWGVSLVIGMDIC